MCGAFYIAPPYSVWSSNTEPEEMDKDVILQEKEAEVHSLTQCLLRKLVFLLKCMSVDAWTCVFCVSQLRRMQQMIAKMQAQMLKHGDGEGDSPHMWERR